MRRYVLAWVGMLVLAIANGALRQVTFAKVLSELRAHQLSTLLGSILVGAFIWVAIRHWPRRPTARPSPSGYSGYP